MTTISVPFCHLPNSIVQVFDMDTCLRTQFQVNTLAEVAARDDFAYFVILSDADGAVIMHPAYDSKCNVMWYDKSGQMWAGMVGKRKFLGSDGWRSVGKPYPPKDLNDVVYKCRTM